MSGEGEAFPEPSAERMLEFTLKVKCRHRSKAPKNSEDPRELYENSQGECECVCVWGGFSGDCDITMTPGNFMKLVPSLFLVCSVQW